MKVLAALLLLIGCAPIVPRQGPVSPRKMPQASEQCKAQPQLEWCK